jgi:hypothetical protein
MEYVVISALIGILCIGAVAGYGRTQKTKYRNMRSVISRRIDIDVPATGRNSGEDDYVD